MSSVTFARLHHVQAPSGPARMHLRSSFSAKPVQVRREPVLRQQGADWARSTAVTSARRVETSKGSTSGIRDEAHSRRHHLASLLLAPLTAATLGAPLGSSAEAAVMTERFTSAGGIEYYDRVVGDGATGVAGDLIRIVFTAHTYDPEGVEKDFTFDPFGSGGSSTTKGYKYLLGQHDPSLPPGETNPPAGFELGILGGDGVQPMRIGGSRVIRMPASMAYGSYGHHCRYGVKTACEVPPDSPVEFEVEFVNFV
mmetsp:Transcript_22440/g.27067  ORF Transcript_22440/g.27067 Transcript_22440/m.27067 type:complete len:254 (+) Transcript_22440:264-1025(+)|eukprot:CAMPEP_0197851448 /NCGR_PEP_ID=MMETSP1438-20131217/18114_1 /TAXON_ID=1461541 /ORGANISM="Pterosperma sp., Strain CCMP1384" /LENGTH=253 /DNA_ID=CAMNT_0043465051 /DNA_START=264 /DNA_END=1025 /DNA_ORIENTATION=+